MAELVFEKLYTDTSTELSDVCIGLEPDNTITKFFIENHHQGNMSGTVTLSDYDGINWKSTGRLMTSQNVSDIGIKTFPQIGAIGFYRLRYENRSLILAPIYTHSHKYGAPTIGLSTLPGTIRISIIDPEGVDYECYRVVVRKGLFADEYITYDRELSIPAPKEGGYYTISAFGYLNEQLASKESNEIIYLASGSSPDVYSTIPVLATETGEAVLLGDDMIIL